MEKTSVCTTQETTQETMQKVKRLLADLQSSDRKRRKAADTALHAMGNDAVQSMVALKYIEFRNPKARINQRIALLLLCAAMGLMGGGFILMGFQTGQWLDALGFAALCAFVPGATWKAATWFSALAAPTRSELLLLLSIADRRSIPILMDLQAEVADKYQQWQIRKRIVELLPMLDTADAQIIPQAYIRRLARSIESASIWHEGSDVRFVVAILKALEKVGTHDGVPIVEKLARCAQHEEIQQAARACLPHLLVSAERQQVSGTLLRATTDMEPRRELVRAAGAAEDVGANQLLRVADSEPLR